MESRCYILDRKLEIFLVEDDQQVCREMSDLILNSNDLILVGVTNDSKEATNMIRDKLPDAIILDLELHNGSGSGLEVLQDLYVSPLPKTPYILVTTNNSSSMTYDLVRKFSADYILSKHQKNYSSGTVLDFLRLVKPVILSNHCESSGFCSTTTETKEQHDRRIARRIALELDNVGISQKSVGYTYLAEAISAMISDPEQNNICTAIAENHRKSEPSVERAMQNAINRAWKTCDIEELLAHYTAKISSARGNPTLLEFVYFYANKLRNEY